MNLLENFVNKFSIEQKSASFILNDNSRSSMLTKTKSNLPTTTTTFNNNNNNNFNNSCYNIPIYMDNIDDNSNLISFPSCTNDPTQTEISSKKGMRNMFSYNQIEILENVFEQTHYPDSTMREKLSKHLGINASRIQVWFQNRRAKFRKFDLKTKKTVKKYNQQQKHEEMINFNSNSYESMLP
jgi:hypothetical protein